MSGNDATTKLPVARIGRWLARATFYIALPVALLTTSVRFAFSEERVYEYSIDHYDVASVTNIPHADLIAATQDVRAYFDNSEDYLRTRVHDQNGRVVPLFNTREVLHMRDVKDLVRKVYGLHDFSLAFVAAYLVAVCIWSREESLAQLARRCIQACLGAVAVLITLGGLIFTGFDAAFTKFHELSFGNNFWQLDPARDHLVQMFPDGFWQDATLLIAVMTIGQFALVGGGAYLYLRRHRTVEGAGVGSVDAASEPVAEVNSK